MQKAGGNSGEQDVAYAGLLTLEAPRGVWGGRNEGHFSQQRLISVMSVCLQRRVQHGAAASELFSRSPVNQGSKEALCTVLAESAHGESHHSAGSLEV